jgi:hypothetical protein
VEVVGLSGQTCWTGLLPIDFSFASTSKVIMYAKLVGSNFPGNIVTLSAGQPQCQVILRSFNHEFGLSLTGTHREITSHAMRWYTALMTKTVVEHGAHWSIVIVTIA